MFKRIQSILTNIYKVSRLLRTHLYKKVICFVTMCCQQCVFLFTFCWKTFWIPKEYEMKQLCIQNMVTNIYKVSPLLRTHLYNKVFYFVTMCCQQCVFCLHFVGNFLDSKRIWDKTAVYSKVFLQISTKFHACWELIWTKMLFLL